MSFRPVLLALIPLAPTLILAGCGGGGRSISRTHTLGLAVHLPADHAAHSRAENEWWYLVGHLRSGRESFGYEVTVFKLVHVRPPGFSTPVTVYRTDVAITSETQHRFQHAVSYYFPQDAALSIKSLNLRVGRVSLTGDPTHGLAVDAPLPAGLIALHLVSKRTPMYVGGRGYLPFADGYTYYYSLTDLASTGSLQLHGRSYRVTGISWMDHQWGNWSWRAIKGWTWMALQLRNGVQLSVFDFRSTRSRVRAASVLLKNGRLRTIYNVSISALGHWYSPHSHATYPSGWLVRIPALKASLHVSPTVADQEMTTPGAIRASYWEGSGRVRGAFQGHPVTGSSYTELTGYAGMVG